jgi:hypothetical protein
VWHSFRVALLDSITHVAQTTYDSGLFAPYEFGRNFISTEIVLHAVEQFGNGSIAKR